MYISPLIFILIAIAAALGFEAGRNLIRANFSSDQARTARRHTRMPSSSLPSMNSATANW